MGRPKQNEVEPDICKIKRKRKSRTGLFFRNKVIVYEMFLWLSICQEKLQNLTVNQYSPKLLKCGISEEVFQDPNVQIYSGAEYIYIYMQVEQ